MKEGQQHNLNTAMMLRKWNPENSRDTLSLNVIYFVEVEQEGISFP